MQDNTVNGEKRHAYNRRRALPKKLKAKAIYKNWRITMSKIKKLLTRLWLRYLLLKHIIVEPSAKCNLRCIMCMNSRVPALNINNPYMSYYLFKSIVDQINSDLPTVEKITFTGMGEPFLNPNLISMIRYAKKNGLQVTLNTNFTVATENDIFKLINAKIDVLSISIDGATKETFERIRVGSTFEKVLKNVILVLRTKQRLGVKFPKIYFNCVIVKENVHEAAKIIRLAEKLGVDGVNFNKPTYPGVKFSETSTYGLQVKELSSTKLKVDVTYLNDIVPDCRVPRSCYITFDGKVLPCTIIAMTLLRCDYSLYMLGDLTKQSFKDIWFSPHYKELRSRVIRSGHGHMPFCAYCPHVNIQG